MNTVPANESQAQAWLEELSQAWLREEPCDLAARYGTDCDFRQDGEQGHGRGSVCSFAERLRQRAEYCHIFELWAHHGRRLVAVVRCEWWDEATGYWFRGQGNARFELDAAGAITVHDIAIESVPIPLDDRKLA